MASVSILGITFYNIQEIKMKLNWSEIWKRHIVKKASCCGVQLEDLQKKFEEQGMENPHSNTISESERTDHQADKKTK
jgi:hypothetical protein